MVNLYEVDEFKMVFEGYKNFESKKIKTIFQDVINANAYKDHDNLKNNHFILTNDKDD